jgi:ABC-type transport system involved in multi-copper enzyme maturation permease subunit
MNTVDTHPPTEQSRGPRNRSEAAGTVTMRRIVLSELIKLASVRSTMYALATAVLVIAGVGLFMAFGVTVQDTSGPQVQPMEPTGGALSGISLAAYLIAAFGVLAVTGEYRSGTIRSSIAAVPNRAALVAGKTLAVIVVVLPATLAAALVAFAGAKLILAGADLTISLGEPGVLRAVTGSALYLTTIAIFAGGLGWLLRSTAGALAALFGILIVLPVGAYLLPAGIRDTVLPYLPDSAAVAIMQTTTGPGQLAPWTGFGVFTAYTCAVLIAATLLVRHRDA